MTSKRQTNPKANTDKHVPAFHVKDGPINVLDTIRKLRQVRHGLENSPDQTEPMTEARDHVDAAITELGKHVFVHGNHHDNAADPINQRDLEATT